jgi:uncharacterized tellurite resistance protein B-like protein
MSQEIFTMDLSKLLIATAWVDGKLQNEEINSLKDLIFSLEGISAEQWAELEIYIDSPVTSQERSELLDKVLGQVKTEKDKAFVIDTLEKLVQADGVVGDKETEVMNEFREEIASAKTGVLASITQLIKGAINKRSDQYLSSTQREAMLDDFMKNTIYYQLVSDAKEKGIEINLDDQKIRKLCFAGGLMAKVAAVDSEISDEEIAAMKKYLSVLWKLSEVEAELVAEISCQRTLKGIDYYRLTRGFCECTNYDERRIFLACLFQIANACKKTSFDETEEIRTISQSLKLAHKDFIAAKVTISDEDLGLV